MGLMKVPPPPSSFMMKNQPQQQQQQQSQHVSRSIRLQNNTGCQKLVLPDAVSMGDVAAGMGAAMPSDDEIEELFSKGEFSVNFTKSSSIKQPH